MFHAQNPYSVCRETILNYLFNTEKCLPVNTFVKIGSASYNCFTANISMNSKSEIGMRGEELACQYLIKEGYQIVLKNYRQKWGEIDIIAKDPDGPLVFVEVKTMRQDNPAIAALSPEENLTSAKLKKLQKTAKMFAGKHFDLVDEQSGWRIDLVAICLSANNWMARHYKNI